MPAKSGDTVKVSYTGKLDDGSIFDSSDDGAPLEFTLGQSQVIPGFEQAVTGMSPGETKVATIPVEEAYGPRHEELVQTVERSVLPDNLNLEVGARLSASGPNNQSLVLTVTKVEGDTVTLDANHPLAGNELTFELELVEIA